MELFLFCLLFAMEERATGSSWAVGEPALKAVKVASMAPCVTCAGRGDKDKRILLYWIMYIVPQVCKRSQVGEHKLLFWPA